MRGIFEGEEEREARLSDSTLTPQSPLQIFTYMLSHTGHMPVNPLCPLQLCLERAAGAQMRVPSVAQTKLQSPV